MELSNAIADSGIEPEGASNSERSAVAEAIKGLVIMLAPFAPHTAEELYGVVNGSDAGMLADGARFPIYDEDLAKADEIEIPVQVNGKLRSRLLVSPEITDGELREMAQNDAKTLEYIAGKEIVKIVLVPKRLVSIVVK